MDVFKWDPALPDAQGITRTDEQRIFMWLQNALICAPFVGDTTTEWVIPEGLAPGTYLIKVFAVEEQASGIYYSETFAWANYTVTGSIPSVNPTDATLNGPTNGSIENRA